MTAPVFTPSFVGECRCGGPVELDRFVLEMAQGFNRLLARQDEPPLRDDEMCRCRSCFLAERAGFVDTVMLDLREYREVAAMLAKGEHVPSSLMESAMKGCFGQEVRSLLRHTGKLRPAPEGKGDH